MKKDNLVDHVPIPYKISVTNRISVKYRNNWLYDISMDYDHLFFNSVFNTQEFSSAKYQGIEI